MDAADAHGLLPGLAAHAARELGTGDALADAPTSDVAEGTTFHLACRRS